MPSRRLHSYNTVCRSPQCQAWTVTAPARAMIKQYCKRLGKNILVTHNRQRIAATPYKISTCPTVQDNPNNILAEAYVLMHVLQFRLYNCLRSQACRLVAFYSFHVKTSGSNINISCCDTAKIHHFFITGCL